MTAATRSTTSTAAIPLVARAPPLTASRKGSATSTPTRSPTCTNSQPIEYACTAVAAPRDAREAKYICVMTQKAKREAMATAAAISGPVCASNRMSAAKPATMSGHIQR